MGPEARLNVVGWGVKCKHFLPPNSKPRWFIGESFRKSNLQKIPVLQKAALVNRHPLLNLFYEAFVALIAKPDKENKRKIGISR